MSDKTRRLLAIILALAMVGSLAAGVILSSLGGSSVGSAPVSIELFGDKLDDQVAAVTGS